MGSDSQQAITQVLQQDSAHLAKLFAKVKQLKQWNAVLSEVLEEKLAKHCQVANYETGQLVIITHNANWATQIRFQSGQLVDRLRQHPLFADLKGIQCKIIPAVTNNPDSKTETSSSMVILSAETAKLILEAAKTIKHSKLQQALERIAKHTS